MELDYRNMRDLVEIRMKQIDQVSLEDAHYNGEYMALKKISLGISDIIILEKKKCRQEQKAQEAQDEKDD